ncbi:hypothetical protein [Methylobacter sp.]|uniref:hypothetical protein n=1 Tax=Methylobacter sp. TaxID=2051955 RepID=UPI00121E2F48|nr:hypothetical protein [Methylobacter sp.]TAK63464.1 MAG: hypothetical protein EPO18_06700 [Methylobacter sp.]
MKALVLALSLLAPLQALGDNEIPQPVIDALSKTFPRHVPNATYIEIGDLTGDGIAEVVTLLGDPQYNKYEEQDSEIRVAVLTGTTNDGYKVFALSHELPRDPNIFIFLRIQKQSLYLLTSGRGWSDEYQFKMRDGQLVLIGQESKEFGAIEEKKPFIQESFNYLTGIAIYSEKSEKGYKEKTGHFTTGKLIKLTEFNPSWEFFHMRPEHVEYP